jgi:hypothetical protein
MMIERLINELGYNRYELQYLSTYDNFDWGDWSGADRSYWYDEDYKPQNAFESEVVQNEEGKEMCYYCNCDTLLQSEFGNDYRYCPDCLSDIYVGDNKEEFVDPNQVEIDYDDIEDISDNYDGSMKHREIVNRYLTDHWSKKNK